MKKEETHPCEPFVRKGCKVLIMGTFPPKKEYYKKEFFYYQSPRNHFWNRIDNIFFNGKKTLKHTKSSKTTLSENIESKKKFLESKKIGIIDYFYKIKRKKDSSKDKDIIKEKSVLDNGMLLKKLNENKTIKGILCTYKTAYESLINDPNYKKIKSRIKVIQLLPATRSGHKKHVKDKDYKEKLEMFGVK